MNAFLLPSAALDYSEIIGREIGHAIIHWGSGLIYKPQPLRSLEEIRADILALERETGGGLDEIIGGGAGS